MKLRFDKAKTMLDGGLWLCLHVAAPAQARRIVDSLKTRSLGYVADIQKYSEQRSLDANKYFWTLCGKLASKLGEHKNDIYRDLVRGIGDNFRLVDVLNEDVGFYKAMWSCGHLGWICEEVGPCDSEPSKTTLCCYYGSSYYNTAQMSRLIDLAVQECREQGIETMPPDKLEALVGRWDNDTPNQSA